LHTKKHSFLKIVSTLEDGIDYRKQKGSHPFWEPGTSGK